MTELVILGPLVGVKQDILCLVDFLHLCLGTLRVVGVKVRMILAGELFMRFLYLCFRSALFDAKDFIIIAFFAHCSNPL